MSDQRPPRIDLRYFAQSGWTLELEPVVEGSTVTWGSLQVDHPNVELEKSVYCPVPTIPVGKQRFRLHICLKLKAGVTGSAGPVQGTITVHYADAATGQVYWQPWSFSAKGAG